MNATIQKWGNSHGIRLPKAILDQLKMRENDNLEVSVNEDCIVLRKTRDKHKSIEARLEEFYHMPLSRIDAIEQSEEIDTGKPVGDEIW